jgi:hypothetical protein
MRTDRHNEANISFRNFMNVPNKQYVYEQIKHKFQMHQLLSRFTILGTYALSQNS